MNPSHRRSLRAILSVIFLDNLGLAVVYPIFTLLMLKPTFPLLPEADSLSLRIILLGVLIAVFPFAQFLAGPFIGHLADVKGRKFAFTLALLGEAVGFLITGIAIQFMSYSLLIIGRIISGFFAGNMTICLSSISDMSPDPKTRSKNFGTVASVAGISFVIAIIIGGTLSNETLNTFFNSAFPFWAITAFCMINIGIIRRCFTETLPLRQDPPHYFKAQISQICCLFKINDLKLLYPLFFFFMLGWIIALQFLSTFLIEHFVGTKLTITLTFFSTGLAWCIGNMWINRLLIHLFSPKKLLFIALFLSTLSLFAASQVTHFLLYLHLMIVGGLFASLTWTNSLTLISLRAPENMQGKLLGINQSIATISMAVAPLFGGFVGEFDIRIIYLFASCSLLASLIIFILFNLKNKRNRF